MFVKTNNHFVDVTELRRKQESIDYKNFKIRLKEVNPLEFIDSNLHSISSSLVSLAENIKLTVTMQNNSGQ